MSAKEQAKVENWNRTMPSVGVKVVYRNDDGTLVMTTTKSAAELLGGHTAVIWLDGISGCVALDRVTRKAI